VIGRRLAAAKGDSDGDVELQELLGRGASVHAMELSAQRESRLRNSLLRVAEALGGPRTQAAVNAYLPSSPWLRRVYTAYTIVVSMFAVLALLAMGLQRWMLNVVTTLPVILTLLQVVLLVATATELALAAVVARRVQVVCHNLWLFVDLVIVMLGCLLAVAHQLGRDFGSPALVLFFLLSSLRYLAQPCRWSALARPVGALPRLSSSRLTSGPWSPRLVAGSSSVVCEMTTAGTVHINSSRLITADVQEIICEELPIWCRFAEWQLAYSPAVHGISMQTFYRRQAMANLIIARSEDGTVMGGFASEAWHPGRTGFGTQECFVFTTHAAVVAADTALPSGASVRMFHATAAPGQPILWGDLELFGFGGALIFRTEFKYFTTGDCSSFGSPPLVGAGAKDVVLRDFECWNLVTEQEKRAATM